MAELTNEEKLSEAKAALHSLMVGTKEVSCTYRDRMIVFNQTNINQLRGYIAELEALIAEAAGQCLPTRYFRVQF